VTLIWEGGELQIDQCPKDAVARALLDVIIERLEAASPRAEP
jgi:hypothetical protein